MSNLIRGSIEATRFWLSRTPIRPLVVAHRHRDLRTADCFLASYPKSGNTWLRHLLCHALTGQATQWRAGVAEYSIIVGKHFNLIPTLPNAGRLVKTHEPYLSNYHNAIWMIRDPRDVAVSQFFYNQQFSSRRFFRTCTFSEFLGAFLAGRACVYGDWASHCRSWREGSSRANVQTLRYEDLKADCVGSLTKAIDFLGLGVEQRFIEQVVAGNTADAMREKEKVYQQVHGEGDKVFVRSAKAGGWREHFTDRDLKKLRETCGELMDQYGYP